MCICIYVLMAIMYGGFFVHDSLVMESAVNEMAAMWLADSEREDNADWSAQTKRELDKKMWLIKVKSVSAKDKWQSKTIQVKYVLPISFGLVKKILSKGNSVMLYETTREELAPAEYLWTFGKEREKEK